MKTYLGIDQGSSSTKSVLISEIGEVLLTNRIEVNSSEQACSKVSQDPSELLRSVKVCLSSALDFTANQKLQLAGIGFSFQRSGVCAWEMDSGNPIHPLISWRDRSYQNNIDQITQSDKKLITELSGLPVIPDYAGVKIAQLQHQFSSNKIMVATLDSFILHSLSSERQFLTEHSMASRSLLYSYDERSWDPRLCKIFEVDPSRLPRVSCSKLTNCSYSGVPILSSLGDKAASSLIDAPDAGDLAINFGTTTAVTKNIGASPNFRLGYLPSALNSFSDKTINFMMEGIFNSSGQILDLLKKYFSWDQILDLKLGNNKIPLIYLPYRGSGSPDWRYDFPSIIEDLGSMTQTQVLSGIIESIGFAVSKLVCELKDPQSIKLIASGGLAELNQLMQLIADCSGITVQKSCTSEASAKGAASECINSKDKVALISKLQGTLKSFDPNPRSLILERFEPWQTLRTNLSKSIPSGFKEFLSEMLS